ncbi:MAG: hypothetical protein ABSH49_27780 [Bryobacteraceae bacterium]|jgi:hypothetical protein
MSSNTIVVLVVGVAVLGIGGRAWLQYQDRIHAREDPQQVSRHFDREAVTAASLRLNRPNAVASGKVVNVTWKTRDVGVYCGFVKSDGFHEGSVAGRAYYGFQFFRQLKPNDSKEFEITFAVPPMNRDWSCIAELDMNDSKLRPVW